MKKLIIAFALMVMISGATVSVLKWLEIGPFANLEGDDTVVEEVEEEEPPRFVELEPLAVPIFQGEKVATTIHIQIKLETIGEDNSIKLGRAKARIRDSFLRELHAFIPRMLRKTERIDVLILKKRLQMVADRMMEKGLIQNILIQSISDMPSG